MNVSSYVYGTSFYHRFDVRPKLFFSLVFIVEAFIVDSAVGLLLLFFLPMALMIASVGIREWWVSFRRLLPLLVMLVLFIPLQARDGMPILSVGGVAIVTEEGLSLVLRIIARLGGISMALMLLLLTERNEEIISGLRAFHLPYSAALASSMILRFIPYLGGLFTEIRDSMSLRLEEGKRGYPILPSITALVVAAIRMIPDTASSLEERGYGSAGRIGYERMERPNGYFIQWAIGAIIALILFLVR